MKADVLRSTARARFNLKRALIFCFVAVAFFSVFLQFRWGDYYVVSTLESTLEPTPQIAQYLEANPTKTSEDVDSGDIPLSGERYNTTSFLLYDAEYRLTLHYSCEEDANAFVQLTDEQALGADNSTPVTVWKEPLAAGENQQVEISLRSDALRPVVRMVFSADAGATLKIDDIELKTVRPYFTDAILKVLFLALSICAVIWLCRNLRSATTRRQETLCALCICLLAAAVASLPILYHGLQSAHDSMFHMSRIEGMSVGLRLGQFPVRINATAHSGFGYPDPIYYPNLFFYFPALLRLLHISPPLAYKALLYLINLLTAGIAYFSAHRLSRSRAVPLIFTFTYTFAYYRLTDVYTRGALGEALALAFFPLVFYGLHSIFFSAHKNWLALAIGMCGIISSHVPSVLLVVVFLALYCGMQFRRVFQKDVLLAIGKAAGLTAGLCMWWLLPFARWALYHTMSQRWIGSDLTMRAAQFSQLFATFTLGDDITKSIATGVTNRMPVSLGILTAIFVLLYLFHRYYLYRDALTASPSLRFIGNFCLVGFVFSTLFASTTFPHTLFSKLGKLYVLAGIQFAWRFLGPATFFACALAALAMIPVLQKAVPSAKPAIVFAALALPVLLSMPYMDLYANQMDTTWYDSSSPLYAYSDLLYFSSAEPTNPSDFQTLSCEDTTVKFSNCGREPLKVWFAFQNPSGHTQTIKAPLYALPNVQAVLADGTLLDTERSTGDELLIHIPEGMREGVVTASFAVPAYFYLGDAVTILTLLGCALAAVWRRIKRIPNGTRPLSPEIIS